MTFKCDICDHGGFKHASSGYRHIRDAHRGELDQQGLLDDHHQFLSEEVDAGAPAAPARGAGARPSPSARLPPPLPAAPVALPAASSSVAFNNLSQLRSSRLTRNQDHNSAPRNRAGLPDHDPTEGLPVRRWEQKTVRISQDAPADAGKTDDQGKETDSDTIFKDHPLPSFFHQLTPWNQEMVRRARAINPNPTKSIWDPKAGEWIPGIELERREAAKKAQMNNPSAMTNAGEMEDESDKADDDAEDLEVEALIEKRRKALASGERYIEVKKWVPIPQAVAEKMPEPKYLADRRPGMESLYKGAYKATNGFGTLGDMVAGAMSGGATGYDFNGDPNGLATATSMLAPGSGNLNGQADGAATPARKNIPPRRKKKGGPGRKPKNWKPPIDPKAAATTTSAQRAGGGENTITNTTTGEDGDTTMTDMPAASGEHIDENNTGLAVQSDGINNIQDEEDGEGSGSESEGEGSEEGEIAPPADDGGSVHEAVMGGVESGQLDVAVERAAAVPEVDVLGALEAALDKETSENA